MKRYEVRDSVIAVFFTRREAHALLERSHRHTGIKDSKEFEKALARLAIAMEADGEAIENIPANKPHHAEADSGRPIA